MDTKSFGETVGRKGKRMSGAMWKLLLLLVLVFGMSLPSAAAELVLFEAADCEWCETWDREIGEIYPLTEEAKIAPLRRVNIYETRPTDLTHIRAIRFTPTFVLIDDGREVGRILGYPGEEFFWGLLQMELAKLPDDDPRVTRLGEPAGEPETKQGE
jgi:hypothetical protein